MVAAKNDLEIVVYRRGYTKNQVREIGRIIKAAYAASVEPGGTGVQGGTLTAEQARLVGELGADSPYLKHIFEQIPGPGKRTGGQDFEQILRDGIRRFPESIDLHHWLFLTMRQAGKEAAGLEMFRAFAGARPESVDTQFAFLEILAGVPGHEKEALAFAEDLYYQPVGDYRRAQIKQISGYVRMGPPIGVTLPPLEPTDNTDSPVIK